MKLYGPVLSPNVFRPLLVARHIGADLTLVPVDFAAGEHKADAFRRINPFGRVPALEDGDICLFESVAVAQYIAGSTPNGIWPDDRAVRARVTAWQVWGVAHLVRGIVPVQFNRFVKQLLGQGESDETAVAAGLEIFEREVGVLESWLGDGRAWLLGETMTLADLDIAGHLIHAEKVRLPLPERVGAWRAKVHALPAFASAMSEAKAPA